MAYLLDTNVLSEFFKREPDERVLMWFRETDEVLQFISTLTLAEIQKVISRLDASRRKDELQDWFDSELVRYSSRVLSFDLEAARIWADVMATLEKKGRPLPVIDSLIAATALAHDLTLVTRNSPDFAATNVKILDLWA